MRFIERKRVAAKALSSALVVVLVVLCGMCGCSSNAASDNQEVQTQPASSSEEVTDSSGIGEAGDEEPEDEIPPSVFISIDELKALVDQGEDIFILDIRIRKEFASHYIAVAHNIPSGKQLEARLAEVPDNQDVYIISTSTIRCDDAYETLVSYGYDQSLLHIVEGGMNEWMSKGYPVEEDPILSC